MLAISNMDAQITLYMADGTPYPLPTVHLTASGVAAVSVNDALAAAPSNVVSHISTWGSASVSYSYDWQGVILATMSLLDLSRSLQYVYPFMFPHDPSNAAMSGAMTLEGLWWKTTPTPHIFVALANMAAQPRNTTVTLLDAAGASLSSQPVSIPPQGTSFARVDFPPESALGGLRVQYSGGMDDLLVGAGIEDGTAGYSANLPVAMTGMPDPLGPRQLQFASVGIMNGPADPMMGFPKGLAFTPYIYLRNVTSSPRVVQTSVNWMNGSSPQTTNLPGITLQPGESREVTPPPFPGTPPEAFNFVFSFAGSVQDVLAATGGVDATGNYVFPVEPHGVGQHGGMTSVYWTYGGGFDTMYSLWNPLSIAQQAQLLLVGPDGRLLYAVPIRLAPQASAMIDLYELFASGKPDAAGRVMPPGPMRGTAVLTGPKNDTTERMTIVLAGATYNAKTATCGNNCETCNGFTSVSATPSPATVAISSNAQMQDEYTWYTGYQYNDTSSSTWSSGSPSIASIQAHTALLTGVSGGVTDITAQFNQLPTNAGQICSQGNLPPCPTGIPVAQVLGCVLPTANDPGSVSSISYNITRSRFRRVPTRPNTAEQMPIP